MLHCIVILGGILKISFRVANYWSLDFFKIFWKLNYNSRALVNMVLVAVGASASKLFIKFCSHTLSRGKKQSQNSACTQKINPCRKGLQNTKMLKNCFDSSSNIDRFKNPLYKIERSFQNGSIYVMEGST